ncbi:hypothetical protein BGX23_009531 [Mortierella sp. AD031]|nr:hypothetical protein BGX23_009531 [Mortierella sp. AD031]
MSVLPRLQPMIFGGIIQAFKSKYRILQPQHLVDEYHKILSVGGRGSDRDSGPMVPCSNIQNCWKATEIVPQDHGQLSSAVTPANLVEHRKAEDRMAILQLLVRLPAQDQLMQPGDYMDVEKDMLRTIPSTITTTNLWTLGEIAKLFTEREVAEDEERDIQESSVAVDGRPRGGTEEEEEEEDKEEDVVEDEPWSIEQMREGMAQLLKFWGRHECSTPQEHDRIADNYVMTLQMMEQLDLEARSKRSYAKVVPTCNNN